MSSGSGRPRTDERSGAEVDAASATPIVAARVMGRKRKEPARETRWKETDARLWDCHAPLPPPPRAPDVHLERLASAARAGPTTRRHHNADDDDDAADVVRSFPLRIVKEIRARGRDAGDAIDLSLAPAKLRVTRDGSARVGRVVVAATTTVIRWRVDRETTTATRIGDALLLMTATEEGATEEGATATAKAKTRRAFALGFADARDLERFVRDVLGDDDVVADANAAAAAPAVKGPPTNAFDSKISPVSAAEYFRYYAQIPQQQNMLEDAVRTGTYFTAVVERARSHFAGKIVMDVGAGSGALSFFAAAAGARRVYAIEASDMAKHCAKIVENNAHLRDVIVVIQSRVEDVADGEIAEPVDCFVSEPMGTALFNERMIESYLIARDRFGRRNPKNHPKTLNVTMFPNEGRLHVAPFRDDALHAEVANKARFWTHADFYGVDVTPLMDDAIRAYYRQCVVDAFDPGILLADATSFAWDFTTIAPESLEVIRLPTRFEIIGGARDDDDDDADADDANAASPHVVVHGIACWFDVRFGGDRGDRARYLSTAPGLPTTHWFQMRFVFEKPLVARVGDVVVGELVMRGGDNQSYVVTGEMRVETTGRGSGASHRNAQTTRVTGEWDLKDPYYRQCVHPQPGYTSKQNEKWYGSSSAVDAN